MKRRTNRARFLLVTFVLSHAAVTVIHGVAHELAHVPVSAMAQLYIVLVIIAGPLVGLWLAGRYPAFGGWLVALTLAGSLVFGLVNHFVIPGVDHVTHVDAQWRWLFGLSAGLLVVTEATGSGMGVWYATRALSLSRQSTRE
jgi:hypothetical protein